MAVEPPVHTAAAAHLQQVPGQVSLSQCKRATACADLHGLCLCGNCIDSAYFPAGTDSCALCKAPVQNNDVVDGHQRNALLQPSMQCAIHSIILNVLFGALESSCPELLSLEALHLAVAACVWKDRFDNEVAAIRHSSNTLMLY